MKKFLSTAAATLVLASSLGALAAGVWTPWGTVGEVEDYGTGMRVYGLDVSDNPNNCGNTNFARLDNTLDELEKDRITKLILTAFTSGRELSVKLSDTTCSSDRPAIYAAKVR